MTEGVFWAKLPAGGVPVDSASSPEATVDRLLRDLRVSDCNGPFASFYGFASVEQCVGKPLRDLFPSVERARSYLGRILAEGRVVQTVKRPGGARVMMLSHRIQEGPYILGVQGVNLERPRRDGRGVPVSLDLPTSVGTDEPQTQLLLQSIEQSTECMVLADLGGTIIYANSAKADLMGLSREQLIGTNLASFWVPGQEEIEKEMEFATLKDGVWSGELMRRRFDGTLIPVHMRTSLISDSQGHPVAQLRTFHDVSEQASVETRLETESESLKRLVARHADDVTRSQDGYRSLYERSPVANILTAFDGTIVEANPAACSMFKHTRGELLERHLADLFGDAERGRQYVAGLSTGERPPEEEIEYRAGDGDTITVEQSSVAIGSAREEQIWIHFLRDMTQAKRLAEEAGNARSQVARADRLASVGQLVAGVAHELNNPLTGVLSFAHMLRRDVPDDSTAAEDIGEIIEAATRCRQIVRSLLDFSRQSEPRKQPCDLRRVLKDAISLVRNQALVKSIRTVEEIDSQPLPVFADPNQIGQVAVNLACNALDAMTDGGTLTIRTRRDEQEGAARIEFEVEDTGCGIPEDALDRVFDPFFTTKPAGKGTGLGLAVAYGIVEQHGGCMRVKSHVGHGTKVTVRLPVASEEPTDEDQAADPCH